MRHKLFVSALLAAATVGRAAVAGEAGWPQFRGPDGAGHAAAAGLPVTWSESENVAWKTPVAGRGWSSPVIDGGRLWLTTAVPAGEGQSLRALAFDVATGKQTHDVQVFQVDQPPTLNAKNSFASPTPVLDGSRLLVHFGTMGTACLDAATGEVQWKNQDLALDHKEGPGSSPIVYGDLMIVHCDGMDVQYVAALDKRTGQTAWKTARSGPMESNPDYRKAYSTPLVVHAAGRDQLLSPAADNLYAYDPVTGRELWAVRYKGFSNVPRPVAGHHLAFISTGYMKPQMWAVRLDGSGDVSETHVAWRAAEQAPAISSPILVGDELYMVSNNGVATCLDAQTGSQLWRERLGGDFCASPIYADGRLYFFNETGEGFAIKPGTRYEVLAKNTLDAGCMASPAALGRALFVRTETHLYRLETAAAK